MPKLTYEVIRQRTQKYEEIWDRDYAHCMVCGNRTLYTNKAGGSCDVQYACVHCCVIFSAEEPMSLVASTAGAALLDKLRELDAQEPGETPPTWDQAAMDAAVECGRFKAVQEAMAPPANFSATGWLREAAAKVRAGAFEDKTADTTTHEASLTSQASSYTRTRGQDSDSVTAQPPPPPQDVRSRLEESTTGRVVVDPTPDVKWYAYLTDAQITEAIHLHTAPGSDAPGGVVEVPDGYLRRTAEVKSTGPTIPERINLLMDL